MHRTLAPTPPDIWLAINRQSILASPSSPTANMSSETTPLIPQSSMPPPRQSPRPPRSVTFNPQVSTSSPPKRRPPIPGASHSSSNLPTNPSNSGGLRDGTQPMLSALNSKLRRRNSSGAPLVLPTQHPASKIGPQRTTRTAQKLKLLPNPEQEAEEAARLEDEAEQREVYSQFTRIKDPTARRDAARLGKEDRGRLPRVTAFCTAGSYKMEEVMRFLKGRGKTKGASPRLFDECIYSPYRYRNEQDGRGQGGVAEMEGEGGQGRRRRSTEARGGDGSEEGERMERVQSQRVRRFSDSAIEVEENAERRREDLIDFQGEEGRMDDAAVEESAGGSAGERTEMMEQSMQTAEDVAIGAPLHRPVTPDFDTTVHIPEVFLFEYGVVVLWGKSSESSPSKPSDRIHSHLLAVPSHC